MAEMHYARPGAVRRVVIHIVLTAVAGGTVIALSQAYQPRLLDWVASDPSRMRGRAQLLLAAAGAILVLPLVGFAVYVWRLGTRTIREQRFPPEGLTVVRDMLVVRGPQAHSRGRLLRAFSVAFLVLSGLLVVTLWRLATLQRNP